AAMAPRSLVQAGHRVASLFTSVLQYAHFFVVGAGAGSLTKILLIRQQTKPMMMKLISALTKSPTPNLNGPRFQMAVFQFPAGWATAMIGMMKSFTIDCTSVFRATPSTTAIASAIAFCLMRKALKSCHILWPLEAEDGHRLAQSGRSGKSAASGGAARGGRVNPGANPKSSWQAG